MRTATSTSSTEHSSASTSAEKLRGKTPLFTGTGLVRWVMELPMPKGACCGPRARDTAESAVGFLASGALRSVRCRSSSVFEPVLSCFLCVPAPPVFSKRTAPDTAFSLVTHVTEPYKASVGRLHASRGGADAIRFARG